MKNKFKIDSDISKAETLPSFFYKSLEIFEDLKSKIFLKSWQYIGDDDLIKDKNSVFPLTILENYLNEPIVLTKDDDNKIHCLTNVCTHRGNILVFEPGKSKKLVCMYHGRRFNNRGEFEFMPDPNQIEIRGRNRSNSSDGTVLFKYFHDFYFPSSL